MDDLIGAYFNVYGCEVVQENFQHLGEKRYVIKESNNDERRTDKEQDPFGRPGGKYGGVPKEGSGYDRGWKAIKKKLKELDMKENIDIYDIVSEYLVSEGFCESYENADTIMTHMSEEWRDSIIDEAKRKFGYTEAEKAKLPGVLDKLATRQQQARSEIESVPVRDLWNLYHKGKKGVQPTKRRRLEFETRE